MKLLHSTTKETIVLEDQPFAQGGEGALYQVLAPKQYLHTVAKIYHPNKRNKERQEKLRYLIAHPPVFDHAEQATLLSWPLAILEKQREFMGFLMPKAVGEPLEILATAKLPKRLAAYWHRFDFGKKEALVLRQKVCFNIAVALYHIHKTGHYVVVDLKPDNILMQHNGLISLVDMDSIEVVQRSKVLFPAAVATPEFAPPEFHSLQRNTETIPANWDCFSMAIIFYKILLGIHPFAATAKGQHEQVTGLGEKIQHGLYVHNKAMGQFFGMIPPPHKEFNRLPAAIQYLFNCCFVQGIGDLASRPSAEDWCWALDNKNRQNAKGDYAIPVDFLSLKIDNLLPKQQTIFEQPFEQNMQVLLQNNLPNVVAKLEQEHRSQNKIYLPVLALPLGGFGVWNSLYFNLVLGLIIISLSILCVVFYFYKLKQKNKIKTTNSSKLKINLKPSLQPLLEQKIQLLSTAFQEQKKQHQKISQNYLSKLEKIQADWQKNIFDYEKMTRLLNSEKKEKLHKISQLRNEQALWERLIGKTVEQKQEYLQKKYLPQQLQSLSKTLEQEIKKIDETNQAAWQKLEKAHYANLEAIDKSSSLQKLKEKAAEEEIFIKKRQEIIDAIQTQKKAAELRYKTQQNLAKTSTLNYCQQLEDIEAEATNKKMAVESSYDLRFQKMLSEIESKQKEAMLRMKDWRNDFYADSNALIEEFKISCKTLLSSKKTF